MTVQVPTDQTPGWAKVIIALLIVLVILIAIPSIYMITMMMTHGFMPIYDMRGMMGR